MKSSELRNNTHDNKPLVCRVMVISSGDMAGILCDLDSFEKGDLLYLPNMDKDYMDYVFKSSGILAKVGGLTCHMSIVCRELGTPSVVYQKADELIGKYILLDYLGGKLYAYNKS